MGVTTGCGCKEVHVYRFPHTTYPYSSCICSFLQQHPYFLFLLNPRRTCAARVTVVVLCVCMCVCMSGLQINARPLARKGLKLQLASETAHTARPVGEL